MKIIKITNTEFDNYAEKHKYRNFYQTSSYANLMEKNGFEANYLGFQGNDNKLVGATLILSKKIFEKYKYAYAPHGFLIDYLNSDIVNDITSKLKKLLLVQNYIFFKIDPLIHCSERNSNGEIISYNPKINSVIEILKKAGFEHHGFNKYFENLKPRWNAVLRLDKPKEELFNSFSKQIRNKLRKAKRNGIEVYQGSMNDLPLFYDFIKKKHNRSLKYYQEFNEYFNSNGNNNFEIYFAKINPKSFIQNAKNDYENELNKNDECNMEIQRCLKIGISSNKAINKKMISDKKLTTYKNRMIMATSILKDHPDGLIIASCAIVKYDKGINLLIDGYNSKYGVFSPNYLLKWGLIQKYANLDYHYFNLNAITGEYKMKDHYSGLNESKLGFNANSIEFIGEFDYIINPTLYNFAQTNFIRKKIAKKIN